MKNPQKSGLRLTATSLTLIACSAISAPSTQLEEPSYCPSEVNTLLEEVSPWLKAEYCPNTLDASSDRWARELRFESDFVRLSDDLQETLGSTAAQYASVLAGQEAEQ